MCDVCGDAQHEPRVSRRDFLKTGALAALVPWSIGAAIAAVTCLFVLLTALSSGIRHTLIDTATTLTTGHLNVGGFYKVTSGQAGAVVVDYETVKQTVKKVLPELDFTTRFFVLAPGGES